MTETETATIETRNTIDRTAPVIGQDGQLEVLADYPAFKFVRCPVWARLKHGSKFAVPYQSRNHGILHKHFSLGSVVGYAVECGDDPLAELERAKERGHKLHWANASATVLSAHQRAKETVFVLNLGDTITFEGIRFRLDPDHNDNIKLTNIGRSNA
jgi:hypothetical protein